MDLGVMISITLETDISTVFQQAHDAGFTHGQINLYINGITPEEVRLIAMAAAISQFHVDAIGCYINPVRLTDSSLHGVTFPDWKTVVENLTLFNGVQRIVCWSGTVGKTMATPNLLNQEESTFSSLFTALHGMLEQVRGFPIQILLEPFTAHVLHDAPSCLRMVNKFPTGDVKLVLDAPNLVSQTEYSHRDAHVQEIVKTLAPQIGLVHLKDLSRSDDGQRIFPKAGDGALNYSAYLRAILQYLPDVPMILDSVSNPDEMIAARDYVNGILKEYGR